jgi:hypothetical protein
MVATDVLHATMMLLGWVLRTSLAEFSATTSKTTISTARVLIAQILTPRVMTVSLATACQAHKKGNEAVMEAELLGGNGEGDDLYLSPLPSTSRRRRRRTIAAFSTATACAAVHNPRTSSSSRLCTY